jgi:hypothetical protein
VVDRDDPDLVVVADAPEGADQVAGLDRPSGTGGEHEIGWRPAGAHVGPVAGLTFGLELEGLAGEVQQRECAAPGVRLDRAEDELAADALDLLVDMDGSSLEVDVAPVQAQGFAAS